jgi:hypothetical protein
MFLLLATALSKTGGNLLVGQYGGALIISKSISV